MASPELIREAVDRIVRVDRRFSQDEADVCNAALAYAALIEAPARALVWDERGTQTNMVAGMSYNVLKVWIRNDAFVWLTYYGTRPAEWIEIDPIQHESQSNAKAACEQHWQQYVRALLNLGDGKGVV